MDVHLVSRLVPGPFLFLRNNAKRGAFALHYWIYDIADNLVEVDAGSSPVDVYWGLRLDYKGTTYSSEQGAEYIVRFTTNDYAKAKLPVVSEFPNTGHGFTAGNGSVIGIPELKVPDNEGGMSFRTATIVKKTSDGDEVIEAVLEEVRQGVFEFRKYE